MTNSAKKFKRNAYRAPNIYIFFQGALQFPNLPKISVIFLRCPSIFRFFQNPNSFIETSCNVPSFHFLKYSDFSNIYVFAPRDSHQLSKLQKMSQNFLWFSRIPILSRIPIFPIIFLRYPSTFPFSQNLLKVSEITFNYLIFSFSFPKVPHFPVICRGMCIYWPFIEPRSTTGVIQKGSKLKVCLK